MRHSPEILQRRLSSSGAVLAFGSHMTFIDPESMGASIVNHITGRKYTIRRLSDLDEGPTIVSQIVAICCEPEVYDWIFREPLAGGPYTEEKAEHWLRWAREGWATGSHFVFAVVDDKGQLAAACDIKSNDPMAEVGYWASQDHRGVMTNTLKEICSFAAKAGFKGLFAWTKSQNLRSRAVLERAGFVKVPSDREAHERFELLLSSGDKEE
jgi:RimJ/RimL family protein N-acetyltransferase